MSRLSNLCRCIQGVTMNLLSSCTFQYSYLAMTFEMLPKRLNKINKFINNVQILFIENKHLFTPVSTTEGFFPATDSQFIKKLASPLRYLSTITRNSFFMLPNSRKQSDESLLLVVTFFYDQLLFYCEFSRHIVKVFVARLQPRT